MTVSPGQLVKSTVVNNAFMSRTASATDTVAVVTVSNTTQSTNKDTGAIVTEGGVGIEKNLNVGGNAAVVGNISATGTVTGSNLSGTNTGDVTLANIGVTPNADGAILTGQQLALQPANASFGGVVTTTAQTFAGDKTFNDDVNVVGVITSTNTTQSTDKDTGAVILEGGLGVEKNINAGGTIKNADTTQSTDKDTGAIVTEGGVGIEKNLNVGGNVVITGDLTVNGTTTTINTATLDVEDTNITVNNGGNDASSEGAGLTVERTGTSGSLAYANALASKFKIGDLGSESEVMSVGTAQTVSGVKTHSANIIAQALLRGDLTDDNTTTGSNATISAITKVVHRLTNASLASIDMIGSPASEQLVVLINATGTTVTVNHNTGGTAANRIFTGTGSAITLVDDANLWLVYDSSETRWRVIGGSGSSSFTSPLTTKGDLFTYSTLDTRLPVGTNDQYLAADSAQTTGLQWRTFLDQPSDAFNYTISCSVGSSALTIALKTKSGTDPSASDPVKVAFRNATASTGDYTVLTITSALSFVVSSGSTLGHISGLTHYIWVYLFNDGGTPRLGASTTLLPGTEPTSSTAEGGAGAADSGRTIYTGTAVTNKAYRILAKLESTQTTAGTWAAVPGVISLNPPLLDPVYARYSTNAGNTIADATSTIIDYEDRQSDTHGVASGMGSGNVTTTNTGFKITVPRTGKYFIGNIASYNSQTVAINDEFNFRIHVNGSNVSYLWDWFFEAAGTFALVTPILGTILPLTAGDYIEVIHFYNTTAGGSKTLTTGESDRLQYVVFQSMGH